MLLRAIRIWGVTPVSVYNNHAKGHLGKAHSVLSRTGVGASVPDRHLYVQIDQTGNIHATPLRHVIHIQQNMGAQGTHVDGAMQNYMTAGRAVQGNQGPPRTCSRRWHSRLSGVSAARLASVRLGQFLRFRVRREAMRAMAPQPASLTRPAFCSDSCVSPAMPPQPAKPSPAQCTG